MRELLEEFFTHYLRERNLEDTLALLTDHVISLGTGEQEEHEFFPLRYSKSDSIQKISSETGEKLMELVSKALPGGIMGDYPPDQKWVEESMEQQFRERNEYKVEYRVVGKDGRDAMISIITDVYEHVHFCRFHGICYCKSASVSFSSAVSLFADADDQCKTFILRDLHDGKV